MFSGVTDCYQPLEASYRLTRALPGGVRRAREPGRHHHQVGADRARRRRAAASWRASPRRHVTVSIPFWDPERARAIEPYVATPPRRLRMIETLARARASPVGVNVAPIIPGLNDQDIPRILTAARDAGATSRGLRAVRLPGSVKQVFEERLRARCRWWRTGCLHRIRETRGGQLYDPRFGARGRGEGQYADAIRTLFETTAARLGYERGMEMDDGRARSGHVDDVEHDGQTAVAQRKAGGGAQAQLTFGFRPGGGHDGGAPATKVRA